YLFLGIRVAARLAESEVEAGTPGCKFHKCQARKYGGSYIRIPMVNVGQYQGTPVAPHVLYERTNFLTGTIFLSNDVLHNDLRSAPAVQEKVAPNGLIFIPFLYPLVCLGGARIHRAKNMNIAAVGRPVQDCSRRADAIGVQPLSVFASAE